MITNPTTLVLGAGASIPYGFPSGEQLRTEICKAENRTLPLFEILEKSIGYRASDISNFVKAFLYSNVASIDAFLSRHDHFVGIGKDCIAILLAQKEHPSRVIYANEDHWYKLLWQVLIEDARTIEDLKQNKIRFISFNYDRSLEYFLFEASKHTFGLDDFQALDVVRHFKILHVYGKLGEFGLDVPSNSARPYSVSIDPNLIKIAATGIQVIPEARDDSAAFQTAREWFAESGTIGFLGFGFDSLNVHRLGLIDVLKHRHGIKNQDIPQIIASVYGKTNAEINRIHQKLCKGFGWGHLDKTNTMTIRETRLLE